jgi:hypothetical protein
MFGLVLRRSSGGTRPGEEEMLSLKAKFWAVGVTLGLTAALIPGPAAARPVPVDPATPASSQSGALARPDAALGNGWRSSSDVLVTGVGDTGGFHLYVAREKDAFAWSTLATLNAGLTEVGAWTGYVCVTGSGRYAVAVYAPATAVNKPALLTAGAFAAVVDTRTGAARLVTSGVQLAYFNPSCGPGDRALLTRPTSVDLRETDLLAVDAVTARVTGTRRIKAQFTTPVPAPDGDYGIVRGALVKVGGAGQLTTVATPGGQPFAVRGTARGAIDLVTVRRDRGEERAVAYRYAGGRLVRLGDAPRTRLNLFGLSGGRDALVGDVSGLATGVADLSLLRSERAVREVSREGHLLALEMQTQQAAQSVTNGGAPARPQGAGRLRVTVQATQTGQVSAAMVQATPAAAAATEMATAGVPVSMPDDPGPPACAVPRNDIHRQVLQPSANQVEWAVDLAVRGDLNILRPADYFKNGLPAYRPQTMFPLPAGGPHVPAQLMLAILAQESNMAQASWHAVPGDAGNPLISDYYGNRWYTLHQIYYPFADCGYGIGQVTDGMRADATNRTPDEKVAIATDYAANVAAALQILVAKWNELQDVVTVVNDNDPRYIENWYMAVWAYNSGVHPRNGSDPYGVGWLNNPANPIYPASRQPFLRGSRDDASHPGDWSYPEKIMGWAETPQWQWIDPFVKYAQPTFGRDSGAKLALPGRNQFCDADNGCTPDVGCPAVDWTCWWHGHASWTLSCVDVCATENLVYVAGAAEPELKRVYPTACTPFHAASGTLVAIVDDLLDPSANLLGCPSPPRGGKFTLRAGSPPGTLYAPYGQVDLHQLGAGYLGHSWFTHVYGVDEAAYHKVVATWSPDLVANHSYQIVAHLPSHGANAGQDGQNLAQYLIWRDVGGAFATSCELNQNITAGQDLWVGLGSMPLGARPRVQLSNIISGNGQVDIAFDAIAFVDIPATSPTYACGSVYPQ